jgi:hypothetical protein
MVKGRGLGAHLQPRNKGGGIIMAKFKTLKIKDKKFVFTSYDNDKADKPASVLFERFPQEDELFMLGDRKNLFENIDAGKINTEEGKKAFLDAFINQYLDNIKSGRVDYESFLRECVSEFHNFEYDGKEINTVDSFLTLPEAAVRRISNELYSTSTCKKLIGEVK